MKKLCYVFMVLLFLCPAASNADDKGDLEDIFGQKGYVQEGVIKFSFPRSDLSVRVGDIPVETGLALTSWAAFKLMQGHSMIMGDLVLMTDEIMPVVRKCEETGIVITALHNHLTGSSPNLMYLHFTGKGEASKLASALKSVLSGTATPLSPGKTVQSQQDLPAWTRIEAITSRRGQLKGNIFQFSIARNEKIMEGGMEIPPVMGVANSINFQVVGEKVATTGDFVLIASEVNPVVKALSEHGIQITAIHNHMLTESPRLFFLHFWGYDSPENVAKGIKAALDKVNLLKEQKP